VPADPDQRRCGECSLCCTVLRVDELSKLGGISCLHQDADGPGCAIHAMRPQVCRGYACLWLRGGLPLEDRPDRLSAVLDLRTNGMESWLEVREAVPGATTDVPRLAEIVAEHRERMAVRISDVDDVLDDTRPRRELRAGGVEHVVRGEWTEIFHHGELRERRRLPWLERLVRRASVWWLRRRLRSMEAGPVSPLDEKSPRP